MSRIRSIKPDLWTDGKVVQLPYEARLLFVGMWNFADDDGRMWDEPDRIKMQVFPADQCDVWSLIDLLVAIELVERFEVPDGRRFLQVPGFAKHQKISHKTPSRIFPEQSRKLQIPASVRRKIAEKYGCEPGRSAAASCYFCGEPGLVYWHTLSSGSPSAWVSFSKLEIDHFVPESKGGDTAIENLVLSCRHCNRSRCDRDPIKWLSARAFQNPPETSGALRPEGKGIEGKGIEWSGRYARAHEGKSPSEQTEPADPPSTSQPDSPPAATEPPARPNRLDAVLSDLARDPSEREQALQAAETLVRVEFAKRFERAEGSLWTRAGDPALATLAAWALSVHGGPENAVKRLLDNFFADPWVASEKCCFDVRHLARHPQKYFNPRKAPAAGPTVDVEAEIVKLRAERDLTKSLLHEANTFGPPEKAERLSKRFDELQERIRALKAGE